VTNDDQKELFKQAVKEWMDEQYAKFGKWILGRLLIAGLTSFLLWYIAHTGKLPF
jgi:hypothetical protein